MKNESMLREVKVEDAIGMVLAHDLTQIIPGQFKGRLFKKGHIIREDDIPALLSIGKEHIYTIELKEGVLHEDEAALRMARAVAGENVVYNSEPHEGKVTLKAAIAGLAKVYKPFVDDVNETDQVILSTVKNNTVVKAGQSLAGTRVIPLIVEEIKVERVEQLAAHHKQEMSLNGALQTSGLIEVKPFRPLKVGLITTGSEVFKGRITDKFGPIVKEKVAALGSEVIEQRLAPDDSEVIISEIRYFLDIGADLILVTGGMSVDPDDRTPGAISRAGARIVSYGTPMLPGSMLLMGYIGDTPIMGLPGCVMHDPYTSFDELLPRICAGEPIVKGDIVALGYGGLLGC
ncbi:molybdopterin-binding protein [Paenibacillus thalictri]|uniref:Molybdopterin molybdenumtransferase n=1 Tax=Paenibacillus thalictri TaxID=2527873 RepID=A0A4Q9DER2_9BACL|nr:molybdopterin-binding protein [Paenibacillus thalictri]TBL67758.1 molybdopterin-binding protein [Paenibacillus thalictri]